MTVAELIAFLQTQPQDLEVIYECYSEAKKLEADEIQVATFCEARPDGWVQSRRSDMKTQVYLVFPGN